MPTIVEKIPGEPILIIHATPADNIAEATTESIQLIRAALDEQSEKVFVISDLREITMDLDEIIRAASAAARGIDPLTRHKNIRENISVLRDGLLKSALRGFDSATFGRVNVRLFDTLDEALAYCREKVQTGSLIQPPHTSSIGGTNAHQD